MNVLKEKEFWKWRNKKRAGLHVHGNHRKLNRNLNGHHLCRKDYIGPRNKAKG